MKKALFICLLFLCTLNAWAQDCYDILYRDKKYPILSAERLLMYFKDNPTPVEYGTHLAISTEIKTVTIGSIGEDSASKSIVCGWDWGMEVVYDCGKIYLGNYVLSEGGKTISYGPKKKKYLLRFTNGETYSYTEPYYQAFSCIDEDIFILLKGRLTTYNINASGAIAGTDTVMGDTILLHKMQRLLLKSIEVKWETTEPFIGKTAKRYLSGEHKHVLLRPQAIKLREIIKCMMKTD